MPRIPDAELERLKTEIPVADLARESGVELKAHGADLVGLCPFHEDREPSLVVTPGKNLWHCLGACQAGGSPIDWIMRAEGVSFRHAAEVLRTRLGLGALAPRESTVPKLASPFSVDADDAELLRQVVEFYATTLQASPEALAYLERRGLGSAALLDRFRIGYANRTLGYRLPHANRKEGALLRSRLTALGVLRESGHEHLSGSIVVPIVDASGDVTGLYGRKVLSNLRTGTPHHLYLPGPHRGVWNEDGLAGAREIVLCEALFDAMTFWANGIRNVTTSYGVEGFTEDHLAALRRYGVELVHIAYDRDEAGDRAAEKLAERLMAEGFACHRVLFPKGMDANEYARRVEPAARSLELAVKSSVWIGNGKRPAAPAATPARPTDESPEPAAKEESSAAGGGVGDGGVETLVSTAASETSPLATTSVSPPVDLPIELSNDEAVFRFEDRRYRVRGLAKATSFGALRLNVYVSREGISFEGTPLAGFFVDTFDLYVSRPRALFAKQAAAELGVKDDVVKRDMGLLVRAVERVQEERLRETLSPAPKTPLMSDEERADALELLSDPKLLERVVADFETCGVVGEETNKLAIYLAAVTRKLEAPLAVVIQSSSAAGKSRLMDALLDLMPTEEKEKYAAMSGQSLFYFDPATKSLKHKILAISEEEGAETASYALKILQSEGELTIASTGKNAGTGRLETKEYRVEGPVMIVLTTTAVEIDEELLNRCLVLTVDESREQTRAIHRFQRERRTLEGLWAGKEKARVTTLHRNAQRLLRPLAVVNPYGSRLTFLDDKTRTRRDHMKYLTLIDAIALLHQYQRPLKSDRRGDAAIEYVEVEPRDIEIANRLASEVLGRSLDELPPQTRRFLNLLETWVAAECSRLGHAREDFWFQAAQARAATGWSHEQVKTHLRRLVELEYVLVHRAVRGQSFVYELLWEGEGRDGRRFVMGLLGADELASPAGSVGTMQTGVGQTGGWVGSGVGRVGGVVGPGVGGESERNTSLDAVFLSSPPKPAETPQSGAAREIASYPPPEPKNGKRPRSALDPLVLPIEPPASAILAPAED